MTYKKVPKISRKKNGKYHMRSQDIVNASKRLKTIIYRMGGDKLFQVIGEYEEYYSGNWQEGPFMVPVLKNELRKLTDDEVSDWNTKSEIICGIKVPFNITQD